MFHCLVLIIFMLFHIDKVHAASAAPTAFTSSTGALSDEQQDIHNEILEMIEPVKNIIYSYHIYSKISAHIMLC